MTQPIFDNKRFVAFLRSKSPSTPYDYTQGDSCILTQYLRSVGLKGAYANGLTSWRLPSDNPSVDRSLPRRWWVVASAGYDENKWTFGAALARAIELGLDQ